MTQVWQTAPASDLGPTLGQSAVHVWRVPLAPAPAEVDALARTLDTDERQRAARFHFERDRRSFTVARGALRTLLGRYLDTPAPAIQFGYRDKGKPYLISPARNLQFNLSHSGSYALIALAWDRELGVDVELRRAIPDLVSLAQASFSPREFAEFCALPLAHHTEAFFTCWSRKEAFIKATGEGVSQLADFDVTLRPGDPAEIRWIRDEPAPYRWRLLALPAIDDHAAALVVAGHRVDLACWQWPVAKI
jgi:4'-phosphopantetheinyl transferase